CWPTRACRSGWTSTATGYRDSGTRRRWRWRTRWAN
ncbi:MAG: hypothetical protein AVDCRST_MAG01-01-3381, partial [uncultured Rubrobacteraceae bacterium]